METVDLLIKNANELVTLEGPHTPRTKKQMGYLSVIPGGSLALKDGKIVGIGKHLSVNAKKTLNAIGKTVLPGFVDPHTHVVFAGSREHELEMKLQGLPYLEILRHGGGILHTVRETRKASRYSLVAQSLKRLDVMLAHGTTTCEMKSGYGLDTATEMKILDVHQKLQHSHQIDIVSTFMGAHAVPPDTTTKEYLDLVIEEMLPKTKGLARFCDVFCEKGVFTIEQSRRVLEAGKQYGLLPRIHADEIVDTGGAKLAVEVGAVSADHLLKTSEKGFKALEKQGTIGVLLPGTPFSLLQDTYAPARHMIDLGIPIALATDLNPNCWTENMQMVIQLACLKMKMTPAEAITAATYNAACALRLEQTVGSLEIGKKADVLILDCPNYNWIPYHFGVNLIETAIKNGRII